MKINRPLSVLKLGKCQFFLGKTRWRTDWEDKSQALVPMLPSNKEWPQLLFKIRQFMRIIKLRNQKLLINKCSSSNRLSNR